MKRIIWSYNVNVEDYKDYLKEFYPNVTDEFEKQNLCEELNDSCWLDEKTVLDKKINGIAIGSIGLWNGIRDGYLFFTNLSDCLHAHSNGYLTVFVEDGELKATEVHHDGTNYYTFYRIKDEFFDFVHNNPEEVRPEMLESLGKDVAEVYGW